MCHTCVTHVSHMFLSWIRNECSVIIHSKRIECVWPWGCARAAEGAWVGRLPSQCCSICWFCPSSQFDCCLPVDCIKVNGRTRVPTSINRPSPRLARAPEARLDAALTPPGIHFSNACHGSLQNVTSGAYLQAWLWNEKRCVLVGPCYLCGFSFFFLSLSLSLSLYLYIYIYIYIYIYLVIYSYIYINILYTYSLTLQQETTRMQNLERFV